MGRYHYVNLQDDESGIEIYVCVPYISLAFRKDWTEHNWECCVHLIFDRERGPTLNSLL
jgi:hypothetical protein